jgi:hypothetical protein
VRARVRARVCVRRLCVKQRQIKELVGSLKTHAAKVEQSARERVAQVKQECRQQQEAAVQAAELSGREALQELRRVAAELQGCFVVCVGACGGGWELCCGVCLRARVRVFVFVCVCVCLHVCVWVGV